MKVQVTLESGLTTVNALLYPFPKKGNASKDYSLTVNSQPATTAMTGGGKYPRYVYVMIGGVSHYLPKNIIPVAGSDVVPAAEVKAAAEEKLAEVVGEGVVAAAKVLTANPEMVEALTKPKKQRVPKAK